MSVGSQASWMGVVKRVTTLAARREIKKEKRNTQRRNVKSKKKFTDGPLEVRDDREEEAKRAFIVEDRNGG